MQAMFERCVLPSGPRVISVHLPAARSFSVVAFVCSGSRVESDSDAGTAHFLEHLTFKGTASYPSTRAVSEEIEGAGGTSNAATDRESTSYWARVPSRAAERAVTVIGELVTQPLLRDADIESERTIIVEEIRSYRDDPGEHIFTLLDEAMYGDSPLGREIAGDEDGVRGLEPDRIREFWRRHYGPQNVVVAVAGDLPHEEARALVAARFGTGDGVLPVRAEAPAHPSADRIRVQRRAGSQAHLCLGVRGLRRDDPDAWVLDLLHTILGEGMSSRLFLHLREEAGLAYDVHSFVVDFADCGMFGVYAGVDPDSLDRALAAVLAELSDLRDRTVPADEFARAKAYARGRLELRLEDGRSLASWLGAQEALHERTLSLDEALTEIDAVTASDVRELAERLLRDDALALAVVAPRGTVRRLRAGLHLP
jgi:predicted Zn-dependent peptidase